MTVSIDAIETTLADAGVTADYYGDDTGTAYVLENGGQTLSIYDAVSGDSFDADNLTVAVLVRPGYAAEDVTAKFEDVETLDEFITAVNDTFGTVL